MVEQVEMVEMEQMEEMEGILKFLFTTMQLQLKRIWIFQAFQGKVGLMELVEKEVRLELRWLDKNQSQMVLAEPMVGME